MTEPDTKSSFEQYLEKQIQEPEGSFICGGNDSIHALQAVIHKLQMDIDTKRAYLDTKIAERNMLRKALEDIRAKKRTIDDATVTP